ncbi:MAG: universal stress protein [Anaerolineales bacterium]|nr:universal stress protein [Anaerolineales bacterium]
MSQPPSVPLEIPSARDMLVGSYPTSGSYEAYNAAVERSYAMVEHEMDNLRAELAEEMRTDADYLREQGFTVKIDVHFGDPAQRIVQYVNDEQVKLVAMATHGRSGLSRLVLGSVAERVLRGASIPVLLLRPEENVAERSATNQLASALGQTSSLRLAAATDGSPFGQRAVTLAGKLQNSLGGQLTVLVTATGREGVGRAQETMKSIVELVSEVKPPPQMVPLVGYADEVLLSYLKEHACNVLVVGAFADRSAGGAHSVGPTAHRLVQEAPASVLLMKGSSQSFRNLLVCASVDDEAVVAVAAQFAQAMGASLRLLHVAPPSAAIYLPESGGDKVNIEAVLQQGTRLSSVIHDWEQRLKAYGFDRSAIMIQPGSAPEVILQHTRDEDYDLVIVGSESSPGHFPGSIANTVVRFADQSVFLVRTRTK